MVVVDVGRGGRDRYYGNKSNISKWKDEDPATTYTKQSETETRPSTPPSNQIDRLPDALRSGHSWGTEIGHLPPSE